MIIELNKNEQNLYNYYLTKIIGGTYRTSVSNVSQDLSMCPIVVTNTLVSLCLKNILDYAETDNDLYLVKTMVLDEVIYVVD